MDVEIKPFAKEKGDAFRTFLKQCWLDTYISEVGRSATDGLIRSMLGDGVHSLVPGRDEKAYLAYTGARLVGSIICAHRHHFLYVWGLYVAKDTQRRGLGCHLLDHAMTGLHADTIVEVSVLKASQKARDFYDKLGFRQVGEERYDMGAGNPVPSFILQAPVAHIRNLVDR
ncbi:GNAT family N-acetyltransferase [Cohaesibacter marisflavi]|uniref:GNAT family N-acetyltransferase n=1 Tax=Cohaesibacter marisflavi TaxID=655353 RepID=UPI0029C8AD95|nr:GNAT family N-acetyltransferase [Cohaesibacter marisflavi]